MIEDNIVEQEIRDLSFGLAERLYYEGTLSFEVDKTIITQEAFEIIYNYLYKRYEGKSSII